MVYINEHTPSIQNELNTFDENFKAVDIANEILDYNLGSGHIY